MLHLHWGALQCQLLAWGGRLLPWQASVIQTEVLAVALRQLHQKALRQLHTLGMDPVASFPPGAVDHGWPTELRGVVGLPSVGVHLAAHTTFDPIAGLGLVLFVLLVVSISLSFTVVLQLVGLAAKVQFLRVLEWSRVLEICGLLAAGLRPALLLSLPVFLKAHLEEVMGFW